MAILLNKKLEVANKIKEEVNFITKLNNNKPHVKVGILNLMPTLEDTERQLITALDAKLLQVELDFIYLDTKKVELDKKEYYQKFIGKSVDVLIEECDNNVSFGHTSNYLYVEIPKKLEKGRIYSIVL